MTSTSASEFSRTLSRNNCEKIASQLPIKSASINWNKQGFYLARVEIEKDEYCINGIFPVATAVDLSAERAILRASFEAVERYCLAAIGAHIDTFRSVSRDDKSLLRFRDGSCESYEYEELVSAIPAIVNERSGQAKLVPVGDVFAPYPKRDGNIGAPSTTNGSGCHRTLELACQSAALELLERHWVMAYWFISQKDARRICPSTLPRGEWINCESLLSNLGYEIKLIQISDDGSAPAILGFAFHRDGSFPAGVCAAAMKLDRLSAIEACLLEIIQTIVALAFSADKFDHWQKIGEPVSNLDHNMFTLAKKDHAKVVRDLIEVSAERGEDVLQWPPAKVDLSNFTFVDVTRPEWKNEVRVVRAVSDQHYKLVVGDKLGERRLLRSASRLPLPHPFP